ADARAPVEISSGGTGLTASPPGSLTRNTTGYVDYIDQSGRVLGGSDTAPARTVYTRRWSIEPLPGSADMLVLQVLVTKLSNGAGGLTRRPDQARLVTVRT